MVESINPDATDQSLPPSPFALPCLLSVVDYPTQRWREWLGLNSGQFEHPRPALLAKTHRTCA